MSQTTQQLQPQQLQQQQQGQHAGQRQDHQTPQQQEPHYLHYSNTLQYQQQPPPQPQAHAGSSAEHVHRPPSTTAPTTLPSITPSLVGPSDYPDHPTHNPLDTSAFIPPSSSGMQGYVQPPPRPDPDVAGRSSLVAAVDSFPGRQSLGAGVDPAMTSRQSLSAIEARPSLGSVDSLGPSRQSLGPGVDLAGRQSLGGGTEPLERPLEGGEVGVDGYGVEAEARHASNVPPSGELDEGGRRGVGGVPT